MSHTDNVISQLRHVKNLVSGDKKNVYKYYKWMHMSKN